MAGNFLGGDFLGGYRLLVTFLYNYCKTNPCSLLQAGAFAEFVNSYMQDKEEKEGGLEDIDDDSMYILLPYSL